MFNFLNFSHRAVPDSVTSSSPVDYRIILWLGLCAALIFIMCLIGAATRLTESGLSITEWKPITGAIPPLTAADWGHAFDLYRATPEYQHKNLGMSLAEFKTIYYWEWAHRFWGRMIGIVFLVPFIVFWARGLLSRGLTIALLGIFALGGLQGGIGWFMVQSGLIDRPSVSHYRLALHLSCALLLYGLIIWTALTLADRSLQRSSISSFSWAFRIHALIGLGMVITTIIWGAFVAGLDAGLIYNEFPTMGTGRLVPAEIGHMTPYWINFFENHASVQFAHRWLGVSTVIMLLSLAAHGMLVSPHGRVIVFPALAILSLTQGALGIATLLTGVNIYIAVAHQGGAVILLGLTIAVCHRAFYNK